MINLNFTKMNGAGNDFIVFDSIKKGLIGITAELVRKLCDRRRGIGADGILHLKPSEKHDFELVYYNSDGSLGSLCANGSRCSIKYASENLHKNKKEISFISKGLIYRGEILNGTEVKFNLKDPKIIDLNLIVKYDNDDIKCSFINTGSPHVVIFWEEIENQFPDPFDKFDLIAFGRKIRFAPEFQPEGTNVNVVYESGDQFYIRTYERGVENETHSCGTGTVAAAVVLYLLEGILPPITFNSFGRDKLSVDFVVQNDKINEITLTGPVKINYIGCGNF